MTSSSLTSFLDDFKGRRQSDRKKTHKRTTHHHRTQEKDQKHKMKRHNEKTPRKDKKENRMDLVGFQQLGNGESGHDGGEDLGLRFGLPSPTWARKARVSARIQHGKLPLRRVFCQLHPLAVLRLVQADLAQRRHVQRIGGLGCFWGSRCPANSRN